MNVFYCMVTTEDSTFHKSLSLLWDTVNSHNAAFFEASGSKEARILRFTTAIILWCQSCKIKLISRHILVPRTYQGRPPSTSPGRPLRILFDHPGDVPIWRPADVLIWRSRDVPDRTFRVLKLGCPNIFFNFSFRTYSIDQIYLKAFQHSRCIENPVKL